MDSRSQIWKPLDPRQKQIRLFELAANQSQSAIPSGRLITVSLNQQLYYDALSHAWGDPSYPEPLYMDGIEWPVTASLFHALTQLRLPTAKKLLWIDALCINQFDRSERSSQVQLMQHIFHRAVTVQIWLGYDNKVIGDLIGEIADNSKLEHMFSYNQTPAVVSRQRDSLMALARLNYFQRLWEAALARSVRFCYGHLAFTMETLQKVYDLYEATSRQTRLPGFQYIHDRIKPLTETADLLPLATGGSLNTKAKELVKVMQRSRLTHCSDARDRIYGMLGIMTAMFGEAFMQADYERTLPDVYTDFAGRLITTTGSLMLLNQVEYICNSIVGLPSWVPDWSSNFYHRDAYRRIAFSRFFHASGKSIKAEHWPVLEDTGSSASDVCKRLKVYGHIFDSVAEVGEYARSCANRHPRVQGLKGSFQRWKELYPGSTQSFARTITFDYWDDPATLRECFELTEMERHERSQRQEKTYSVMLAATGGRCFIVTASGEPGLGPMDTKRGDVLAILAGGNVPYVLRRRQDMPQSNSFSFVGEAYVHGIMYGELLEEPGFAFEEIVLA